MKKIILLLILIFLIAPKNAFAADNVIDKQIDTLKNKVASKVAELKLVEKKGIVGTVQSATDNQITISDLKGNTRLVDVDEITKFSSDNKDDFGISDIKKGAKLSVLGLYNKESGKILARFVNEVSIPTYIHGVIALKDAKNYTLTIATVDGTNYTVDIEDITKTFSFDSSTGNLATAGFSKIEAMQNIIVTGFPTEKEKDRFTAGRIVVFPGIPNNPKIDLSQITPIDSPTPTTK